MGIRQRQFAALMVGYVKSGLHKQEKTAARFLHPSKKIGTFQTVRPFFKKLIIFLLFV
jgi:hypothetical protein